LNQIYLTTSKAVKVIIAVLLLLQVAFTKNRFIANQHLERLT